jgi:hypothetical protein
MASALTVVPFPQFLISYLWTPVQTPALEALKTARISESLRARL